MHGKQKDRPWSQSAWVHNLDLPHTDFVTLSRLMETPIPQFPHQQNEDTWSPSSEDSDEEYMNHK